jgi:hypothetical protein
MKKIYDAKSPGEKLKYGYNWSPMNIGVEVLVTVDATVVDGSAVITSTAVEDVPNARDGQGQVFILQGGVDGEMTEILLEALTDEGSEMEQTVFVPIRQK